MSQTDACSLPDLAPIDAFPTQAPGPRRSRLAVWLATAGLVGALVVGGLELLSYSAHRAQQARVEEALSEPLPPPVARPLVPAAAAAPEVDSSVRTFKAMRARQS